MRETMYIKGQNQLERFLENEGADPFFIENISYYVRARHDLKKEFLYM